MTTPLIAHRIIITQQYSVGGALYTLLLYILYAIETQRCIHETHSSACVYIKGLLDRQANGTRKCQRK